MLGPRTPAGAAVGPPGWPTPSSSPRRSGAWRAGPVPARQRRGRRPRRGPVAPSPPSSLAWRWSPATPSAAWAFAEAGPGLGRRRGRRHRRGRRRRGRAHGHQGLRRGGGRAPTTSSWSPAPATGSPRCWCPPAPPVSRSTPGAQHRPDRRFGTVAARRRAGARSPPSWATSAAAPATSSGSSRSPSCLQCAETVGGLDRVFEFTLEYMGDRFAFGGPSRRSRPSSTGWPTCCCGSRAAKALQRRRWPRRRRRGRTTPPSLASVAKAYVGEKCHGHRRTSACRSPAASA